MDGKNDLSGKRRKAKDGRKVQAFIAARFDAVTSKDSKKKKDSTSTDATNKRRKESFVHEQPNG